MTKIRSERATFVAALLGCYAFNVSCGNATLKGTDSAPKPRTGSATDSTRGSYEASAQLLADRLELDLISQGVVAADARAIALGALEGSRVAPTAEEAKAMGLIDVRSFLPGFLKGALGVAKTLFAGTPLGVASTVVETVVKGFSKQDGTPKSVLASLPAIALEALLKKGGGIPASPGAASRGSPAELQEMLVALLAAGRGVSSATGENTDEDATLSKQMMQMLVATLAKQPGVDANVLAHLLPRLQEALHRRLVGAGAGNAQTPSVLGAISEGQVAAILGFKSNAVDRDTLLALLLQKGAATLLTEVSANDAVRTRFLQAMAQGTAKPVQALADGSSAAKDAKQNLLRMLARTLTGSVMKLDDRLAPLKKQALEASLLGLSRGLMATKGVSQQDLAEVFANVSAQLSKGALTQPGASDASRQLVLGALGQAQIAVVDEAKGAGTDLKRALLESALRGIASGVSTNAPRDELIEALLVALARKSQSKPTQANGISEADLIRILGAS